MRAPIVLVLLALLLASCELGSEAAPRTERMEAIAADLPVVDGSTSTRPLRMFITCAIVSVACDWTEFADGSRFVVPTEESTTEFRVPSRGTNGSYVALAEGEADIALTARAPTDEEFELARANDVELEVTPVALDAFVFLVHDSSPVDELSLDEVRGIFSGSITDWAEVGGEAGPIQPYLRDPTSGSQVLMEGRVMAGTPMIDAPDMMRLPTMMAPFDAISRDPSGIGYSVYYFATRMLSAAEIRLLAIDRTVPEQDTIASGDYPIVTEVFVVIAAGSAEDSTGRMLREWLMTEAGREVITHSGYVPLPE